MAENAAAAPIGIAASTDPNGYSANQLSATITALPNDGTVLLNGSAIGVGKTLTMSQLTSLDFLPTPGAYSQTSPLAYTVTDPSGASAEGTASLTIGPATGGRVLTVGAGQQYKTLAAAVAASQNGDTIEVQAGTYVNDFAQINTNITIEGVGGMAVLEATENIPNGKAILVTDANVTIRNVEFTGATVADGNGAGIRYETGDLILDSDYFVNNQDGLLASANPSGNLLITNTEFDHNGDGTGFTHNIYIGGDVNSLTINDSYFHDAVVGHEIKSRAANTYIYNSRIFDLSGSASYSVDLPNGGNAILAGNVIQQGPNTQSPDMIAYGEEGGLYAGGSLQMYGNTLLNNLTSHTPLGVWNATSATAQIANTQIYGITAGQVATGPTSQTGNTFLSSEPSLDTAHPWLSTEIIRLYQNILGRTPSPGEIQDWEGVLENGATLAQVTVDFATSSEAQNDIIGLYQNILGRTPSSGEVQAWEGVLENGTTLAQVKVDFATSGEAQNDIIGLYQHILGRTPSSGEIQDWEGALENGTTLAQVTVGFATSSEAQNDIIRLYQNILGRTPSSGEIQAWEGVLENGATLAQVTVDFATSGEAQNDLSAIFQSVEGRAPDQAELAGMENQIAVAGASQTSVRAGLVNNGPTGFTVVAPPSGSVSLTALPGPERFDFSGGSFGHDTVVGFNDAQDAIELSHTLAASFSVIQADSHSANGGTLITFNGSQSIMLNGVGPSSLVAANFHVV